MFCNREVLTMKAHSPLSARFNISGLCVIAALAAGCTFDASQLRALPDGPIEPPAVPDAGAVGSGGDTASPPDAAIATGGNDGSAGPGGDGGLGVDAGGTAADGTVETGGTASSGDAAVSPDLATTRDLPSSVEVTPPLDAAMEAPPAPDAPIVLSQCGNGKIDGSEACDDGNTKSGDGCSSTCTIETGYACPLVNAPCVPDCGDGIVLAPMEQCDPGVKATNMSQACSATCKWNPGWACTGTPLSCFQTTCGDGKVEGFEACDDGNTLANDGCSPTCHFEPNCSSATGTCTPKCGDGLVVNEECDDGNTNNGDGCSSTCKVEPGYQCTQPASNADTMIVPVTYRDFLVGGDFYAASIMGSNGAVAGLVQGTLDGEGKPVLSPTAPAAGHIASAASFSNWYRDVPGTNTTYVSSILLHNNGNGGFVNWWKDNQQWVNYSNVSVCMNADCSDGCFGLYTRAANQACFATCTPWRVGATNHCMATATNVDGNPLFFPLDNVPGMITPTSAYAPGETPPMYSGTWTFEPGTPPPRHNFSFTSEVRYWFSYSTSKQYTLDFTGDDDVWVFVNRKLAVDLGGIHTPVEGQIVLNATGGGTVTVTPTEGAACKTQGVVSTCTGAQSKVDLGMTNNGVYEIAVFQAERAWNGSTYKLTLSGFNDLPSVCVPICGDGVVSPGEQCDNGVANNLGGYNQCTSDCRLGPHCGDAKLQPEYGEECDLGTANGQTGQDCDSSCHLPR
jgi:fibro-slime domain-containing protein